MFLLVFGLIILFESTITLKLLDLHIPSHVPQGTRAALSCRWQLGPADVLYSVKWYKDGKEFFRHVPRDVEPRRKFLLPGVVVEDFDLPGSQITLASAVLETGGRYRCEVSGEGPLFPTVSEHADMTVVVLPQHGPTLSGFRAKYRAGDRLVVNCTSGHSRPPTELAWYLNGEPQPDLVPTQCTANGLVTTSLVLDVVVGVIHFKRNVLKAKCLATISPIYWKSTEESAALDSSRAHEHLDKRNTTLNKDQVQVNSSYPVNPTGSLIYLCYSFVIMNFYGVKFWSKV